MLCLLRHGAVRRRWKQPLSAKGTPVTSHRRAPSALNRRSLLKATTVLGGATALGLGAQTAAWAEGLGAPSSVVGTQAWGAETPRGELTTRDYRPTYLVVDQTWTPNTAAYSLEEAKATSRAAQQYAFGQSLPDSAHHFLVARGSQIMEGRHGSVAAAAGASTFVEGSLIGGYEAEVVTVLVQGDYSGIWPTQAMYGNLVHISAYLCQQYGIAPIDVRSPLNLAGGPVPDSHWNRVMELLQTDITRSLSAGAPRVSLVDSWQRGPDASYYPGLTQGTRGHAASRLEQLLVDRGFDPGVNDGVVTAATMAAVNAFRVSVGLGPTSRVEDTTWTALEAGAASGATVARGSSGPDVVALQKALNARGNAGLPPFGFFNVATQSAVQAYQSYHGQATTGMANAAVWALLKAGTI